MTLKCQVCGLYRMVDLYSTREYMASEQKQSTFGCGSFNSQHKQLTNQKLACMQFQANESSKIMPSSDKFSLLISHITLNFQVVYATGRYSINIDDSICGCEDFNNTRISKLCTSTTKIGKHLKKSLIFIVLYTENYCNRT